MPQQKAVPACLPPASWVESNRPGPASELGPCCASESLRWCQPGPRSHVSALHTYRRQEQEESLMEATLPHPVSERTELLQASRTTTSLLICASLPAEPHTHALTHALTQTHTHSHTHIHRCTHTQTRTHSHTHTHTQTHTHIHTDTHTHTHSLSHTHMYPDTHTHTHSLTHTYTHTHTHHTHILKHTLIYIHIPHSNSHTHIHTYPAESSISSSCRLLEAVTTGFKHHGLHTAAGSNSWSRLDNEGACPQLPFLLYFPEEKH